MPSRLSSLLVRDGLVGVKRMEKAFQRQVIYGGSLDTILLEMGLVPEERLTQYLALASGLPPAARDEGAVIDPGAVALITRDLAEQFRAVPVAFERDAIRILVCAPLELAELEDLADQLDRPLQPLITPEYRWNLAFASAYALDPPARFTTLARSLDVDPASTPVGRAPTIIVEEGAPTLSPSASDLTQRTLPPVHVAPVPAAPPPITSAFPDDIVRARRHTIIGVTPNRATTDGTVVPHGPHGSDDITPPSGIARRAASSSGPMPSAAQPRATPDAGRGGARPAGGEPPRTRPLGSGSRLASIQTDGRDSPLPIVRAREILATAEDRDTVFLTLLRAARSRARWAGLLTVQGGAAIGRIALAEPGIDTAAISTVLIPLDAVSPFRTVVSNHQSHIGPLVSGDASLDAMVLRMGGAMPPSALILPIVLRDRVVALVVAHRATSDLKLVDVTELLPMATAASDAIGRLIVKHKAAGYRAPAEAPVVEFDVEAVETKRISRADVAWRTPSGPPSVPGFEQGVEMSMEAGEPRPIDEVLSEIERGPEHGAGDALTEAVERSQETLRALARRFPGKLRVDRFAITGRTLRAAQYGGLLELVIRLGSAAADFLIDRMGAAQRDVRFYATVCAAELRPRNAVFALAERLFDQDFGVRAVAIEALTGYPPQDLGQALVRARRAVHSSDPDIVAAASGALVALGDSEAIPDLVGVIERSDRGGEHARRALTALTAQDFGANERKWRKWYETARLRHRIEWLIEGLGHKEDAIREGAINTLRRMTGEYFGYHHDLPRKERDAAAERWAAWWRELGHRRFQAGAEHERHRPTAELPIRRDP
jgi:type II secretion system (T2SS) protein E